MKNRFKIYDLRFMNGIFLIILTSYFLNPLSVLASTIYFSPSSVNVKSGQLVTVQIFVDPQGSAYTTKVALAFTPGILSFSSFSQASGWLPLTQAGYDSVDNAGGTLVKTAGYAGGFSAPQLFGTVTFVANANGIANISVSNATQILNASNQNTFTGGGLVSVNISTPVPVVTPPVSKPNPPRPLKASTISTSSLQVTTTSLEQVATELLPAHASSATEIPYEIIIPILTFLAGFTIGRLRL